MSAPDYSGDTPTIGNRVRILDKEAMARWRSGDPAGALAIWDEMLDAPIVTPSDKAEWAMPEHRRRQIETNRRYALAAVDEDLSNYPHEVVEALCERFPRIPPMTPEEALMRAKAQRAAGDEPPTKATDPIRTASASGPSKSKSKSKSKPTALEPSKLQLVTVIIPTCKRYKLFTRTMNSFLRCCSDLDLIARWIVIDDGSHPTEREAMRALYPFVEFVWKGEPDAGHARSLNILREIVDTPYVFALEDDWLFVRRMDYVSRCLRVFAREPPELMQVLVNRHYIEIPDDAYLSLTGGILRRDSQGMRYLLHEHHREGTPSYEEYRRRHPQSFAHQPHFALRPAMIKSDAWSIVGPFDESPRSDFETEWAWAYAGSGLRSAYLDGVYCLHIGRLNRDKTDPLAEPNAYQLNGKPQYGHMWESRSVGGRRTAKPEGSRLALTVTTCKRLGAYLRSMRSLLSACKDVALIDRFLVVDDNSSESDRVAMREAFPWFDMICKEPSEKGHARSMNMILDATGDCDFLFHTEDDWDFRGQFSIDEALAILGCTRVGGRGGAREQDEGKEKEKEKEKEKDREHERGNTANGRDATSKCYNDNLRRGDDVQEAYVTQVSMLRHPGCRHGDPITLTYSLDGRSPSAAVQYYLHAHDVRDTCFPSVFEMWREVVRVGMGPEAWMVATNPLRDPRWNGSGCWWPSLTLNPAVWDMQAFRESGVRFREDVDPTYFEYDASLRLCAHGWTLAMLGNSVSHMDGPAAYVLNSTPRAFDASACPNHRPFGRKQGCKDCDMHAALAKPC